MPTLPAVMVTLLLPFERLFDPRTRRKAQLLAMGAILGFPTAPPVPTAVPPWSSSLRA